MAPLVLYTHFDYAMYESVLANCHDILPQEVKDKVNRFRRWQDRQAFILGRLLIWKGLKHFNYEDDCLTKLQANPYGKLYIDETVFFNLSHSGQYVVCAFHQEEIGIDIEEIMPVEINDFINLFSEEEKKHLDISVNPLKDFFSLWTIKESVIKAEGKGLSIPLQKVDASEAGLVRCENESWHVKEINFSPDYCCAVASRKKLSSIVLEKADLYPFHQE